MKLNFKSFGSGDPVVILHGLFGSLDNWQTFAKRLAEDYMVYIVDLRNHGRSPHSEEMNYELMAEDLRIFMEEQWLFSSHIMGHSMGGKAAMKFSTLNPDMVEKLIVLDIGPKAYDARHTEIFDALLGLNIKSLTSRKEAEEMLSSDIKDPGVLAFLLKNLKRKKQGGFEWKMNLPSLFEHYTEISGEIKADDPVEVPTLFVRGSNSDYLIAEDDAEIVQAFPEASIQTIDDAGHWIHVDQPDKLLEMVKVFISE